MKIRKPIFIIGSGRSGTTILYNILSIHPDVAWFSALSDDHTNSFKLISSHRLLDLPVIGYFLKKNIIDRFAIIPRTNFIPVEGTKIYRDHLGFDDSKKYTEKDHNDKMERKFKAIIRDHLERTGRKRFLLKRISNNQRLRLINKMFPDAYYIHIIRDGRAVANSLNNIQWWQEVKTWWSGITPSEWEKMGGEPIELCALEWKHMVEEILSIKDIFDNYMEIRYESFVKETKKTIKDICDFSELEYSKKYDRWVPTDLPNKNFKWKKVLTEHQKMVLERCIGGLLKELGYQL